MRTLRETAGSNSRLPVGVISRPGRRIPLSRRCPLPNGLARALVALLCIGVFGPLGCASPPPPEDPESREAFQRINDPFEPINRIVFAVNIEADRYILKPVAYVYKEAVPGPLRDILGNFLNNLRSPVTLLNALLQGDVEHAGTTLFRFSVNSTLGFAGAVDLAGEFGIVRRNEDFGQTLAVWGVDEGPYLMLPVLGPSNARDAAGRVADYFSDPFAYLRYEKFTYSRFSAKIVDVRARNYELLSDLEQTSVDFYAAIRSLYRQNRRDAIANGAAAELPPLPSMPGEEDDPEDENEKEPARPPAR